MDASAHIAACLQPKALTHYLRSAACFALHSLPMQHSLSMCYCGTAVSPS